MTFEGSPMQKAVFTYADDILSPLQGGVIMSIGQEIKNLRSQLSMTQDEFAERIGIHGRQLARYEIGTNKPSIEVLKKIADFCEVSLDMLIFGKDDYLSKRLKIADQDLLQLFRKIDHMKRPQREKYRWVLSSLINSK